MRFMKRLSFFTLLIAFLTPMALQATVSEHPISIAEYELGDSGVVAASKGGIGATGKIGEDALKALGGEPQVYFRTSQGGRCVDQLVGGVANESKVGYTSLTKDIARQIAKDFELVQTGQIKSSTWHFFASPVTGAGGPSAPLLQALKDAGFGVVIH